ncbi:MAG TPA: hypothetical protein VER17_08560 [Tepidisphaeraceae bacterium]|nr:hypothetical protein [Tepidisphaeraceae bacterium]
MTPTEPITARPRPTPPIVDGIERGAAAAALLLWLLIQIASIALSAARVPLSAHFARPGEALALPQLVLAQMVCVSLLAPILLRGWTSGLLTIVSAGPMLALAAVLSGEFTVSAMRAWLAVACWIAAVRCFVAALPSRFHLVIVAMANLLTLGGLVLAYASAEYSDPRAFPFGPADAAMQFIGDAGSNAAWIWMIAPAVAGVISLVVSALRRSPNFTSAR